ncbi:glycosyl transferase family 39 [Oscillatoria nigro-viridis PCC 7112]|uniref:Glycosyl transferase family 39 n=1 Tax=Phormidium nigroviride PCC 7112 TaxID=179408 RepID=K9VDP0_9CYAN|nr:glycosyltransferase family 39 protein [Oscillatoria nigro-viridis]AFZ06026.1 glycosyl transferase family 39 [Oscillatoria nigro-viridis PCC 7112]
MKEVIKSLSEFRNRPLAKPSKRIAPKLLSLLWLFAIAWVGFLWNLGNIGLVDETEPLFAEAARQMTVTGDWITPYFNGETRFDKPPLIYWLMAVAYRTLGVNELAVRLPSALCAIGLTCLGFYTLSKEEGRRKEEEGRRKEEEETENNNSKLKTRRLPIFLSTPWIGAALIALNPHTIAWGRTGVSDMLLVGCMCSALLAFFLGYTLEEQREKAEFSTVSASRFPNKWYLTFYVLIALAILAKGPVGIVVPALIVGSFGLYLGNFRQLWREMRPVSGILIILAIALPWYILVILANGQTYIDSFFGYHNFQRFTGVVNKHSAPRYFYFFVVLVGFAPWSIYLPVAIARTRFWQRSYWRRQPRSAQLSLFALFWFACIFGFFTIAVTKLPSYVLPLIPAAAILVTLLWSDIIAGNEPQNRQIKLEKKPNSLPRGLLVTYIFNVVFLLMIAGATFYCYNWLGDDPAMPNFPQAIQQSGLLIVGGTIWITTAVAIALLLWKRQQRWIVVANLIGLVAFIIFGLTPAYKVVDINRQLPLRQLAQVAVQQKLPGEEFIMVGFWKPSLVFYTQGPVTYYRAVTKAIDYIKESKNPTSPSILLLGYPEKFVELGLQPNQYQLLDSRGAYQLARVLRQAFR